MGKKTTIKDVAAKVGVSIGTVSRIINNDDKKSKIPISQNTKQKVHEAIKSLNYKPNYLAKSLAMKKTFTIGVVVPSIGGYYFPEVIEGIEFIANKNGYNLILCNSMEKEKKEKDEIEMLNNKRVDGLIIIPTLYHTNDEYFDDLKKESIHFVLINRILKDYEFDYVATDNEKSAYDMVSKLIQSGYKKILYINHPVGLPFEMPRYIGYKKAMTDNGLIPEEKKIKNGWFRMEDGYNIMKGIIEADDPLPEVIFAANDSTAIGAIKAITDQNMKVPDDIAVVGFTDDSYSKMINPSLTTVHQPKKELGIKAAEMLLDKINNDKADLIQMRLNCNLVFRDSCRLSND